MKQFRKKCNVCGADFAAGSPVAKYCPDCREAKYKEIRSAAGKKQRVAEGTIYTCDCCGKEILARGKTTRKTCTACMYQLGPMYRRTAKNRKQLAEEVIS